jgi:hypothetical protein
VGVKVALIPPRGWENYFADSTGIQMTLALPELFGYPAYVPAIANVRRRGDYIIMDNGAAEGKPLPSRQINTYADMIGANEIVLPDALGDANVTLAKTRHFLRVNYLPKMKYMAVVQGTTPKEIQNLILQYDPDDRITTLGIPRDMMTRLESKSARIDLANWICTNFPNRFEIHFLGAHAAWPQEVKAAAKYCEIRSTDTSLPFNFAIAGEDLKLSKQRIVRRSSYFVNLRDAHPDLVKRNIETYLEWAQG